MEDYETDADVSLQDQKYQFGQSTYSYPEEKSLQSVTKKVCVFLREGRTCFQFLSYNLFLSNT